MKRIALVLVAALAAAAQAQPADGEVTKVDRPGARITIKHRGVKNLDMPPMTMAFHAPQPQWLEQVAVGDKVRFAADKVNGAYTLTELRKAP